MIPTIALLTPMTVIIQLVGKEYKKNGLKISPSRFLVTPTGFKPVTF